MLKPEPRTHFCEGQGIHPSVKFCEGQKAKGAKKKTGLKKKGGIKAKAQNNVPGSEGSIPREGCQPCFPARDWIIRTQTKHSEEKLLDFEPVVWGM